MNRKQDAAKNAIQVAEKAVALNERLIARLNEADEIIKGFVALLEQQDEQWQQMAEIVGGDDELRRLRDSARKWVVLHENGRRTMKEINDRKAITPDELASVRRLNKGLQQNFPKPTPRYAEIARQLDMPARRVRHILEKFGIE